MTEMEEEFTTINRQKVAAVKRNKRLANKQAYLTWAENFWPSMLMEFLNLSMEKYEKAQPQLSEESESDYTFRYEAAHAAALRRHGTCSYSVEECIERGHSSCEEKRRRAYEAYLDDQSFGNGFIELPVPVPVSVPLPVEKKKVETPTVKVKKLKPKPEVVQELPQPLPEPVTPEPPKPKVIVKKKAPKSKTEDDLEIDKLLEELSTMPAKKKKGNK